jgi:hypothetical protein
MTQCLVEKMLYFTSVGVLIYNASDDIYYMALGHFHTSWTYIVAVHPVLLTMSLLVQDSVRTAIL